MTWRQSIIKKNIELVLMWPFVAIGRLAGILFPLKTDHHIFLFFSWADIGGATKVNIDITKAIIDQKPLIIFSKKPNNNQFIEQFKMKGVRIIDLHRFVDNKLLHFINFFFRGVVTSWINKSAKPVAFGGESIFFFKVLPHLKKNVKTIELAHVNKWINYTQAFIKDIDARIYSTKKLKEDVEKQYKENDVPPAYFSRLYFADNKIDIPPFTEIQNEITQVLFVGRGHAQKRIHLIAAIVKKMHDTKAPVHFSFVGDVDDFIPDELKKYCTLYGFVKDRNLMNDIYMKSDILLLTSAFEGLPIVVMDMMARGKVVISTAVNGIPDYIVHEKTGLLIKETKEEAIIDEGVELINKLLNDPALKRDIGKRSYTFATLHFSEDSFNNFYKKILTNEK